jgi:uncharacterized membrane protein (DUF373 family)
MPNKLLDLFESIIVATLMVFLILCVGLATFQMWVLLIRNAGSRLGEVTDARSLQSVVHAAFGGVLSVLLGLELIETVRHYRAEHHVRLEIIFVVAMIAVGRHIIQLDYHDVTPLSLFATTALILGLVVGYTFLRRTK